MTIPSTLYSKATRAYAGKSGQGELIIQSMITLEQIVFAAFLSDFSQAFKSNWNEERVYGRNDPIATFQGTTRTISLAFDIPSGNIAQAQAALKQCDHLMKFLYPAYNNISVQELGIKKQTDEDKKKAKKEEIVNAGKVVSMGSVISHPPLVKVRFANLLKSSKPSQGKQDSEGLLGYLDGLNWSPALDMGVFLDGSGNIYPKVINLSFGMTVLHQADLGWNRDNKTQTLYKSQSFFPGPHSHKSDGVKQGKSAAPKKPADQSQKDADSKVTEEQKTADANKSEGNG